MDEEIQPGQFWQQFYVIALLGEGGMSSVYLAYDLIHARLVALKFLTGMFARNPKAVARMHREGAIYRTLDHPSVVRIWDVAEAPGHKVYLVLEFLRGAPLDEVLEERGEPLPVPRAVRILEDVGSALNFAHRKQVIHRDVKPQNVMIGPDGRATLLDFGIARAEDGLVDTQSGSIMGTMAYASPEQRAGQQSDHRADIYALGAIVYEAVTGRRVVPLGNYDEMLSACRADLTPPSELDERIPPALDQVLWRLLEDDPARRYPELRKMLIELGLMRVNLPEVPLRAFFGDEGEAALDEASKALRDGEARKAIEITSRLAQAPPPGLEAESLHLHARANAATGQPGVAVHYYQRSLEVDPAGIEVVADLGLHLLRMGKVADARDLLTHLPSWIRGHLVVRALLDLIRALPEMPALTRSMLNGQGEGRQLHAALAKVFG